MKLQRCHNTNFHLFPSYSISFIYINKSSYCKTKHNILFTPPFPHFSFIHSFIHVTTPSKTAPTGSPSRGGDVFDRSQPSLPTSFHSVLVSVSVFMALSTVFYSINSPDNSPLSLSLLFRSYFCLIGPFNYMSLYESLFQP